MVKAKKGTLVTWLALEHINDKLKEDSDAAVTQIIKSMNETEPIIIQELDDTHVVIKTDALESLKERLEAELERNTYTLE